MASPSAWAPVLVLFCFLFVCSAARLRANSISTKVEGDSSQLEGRHSMWDYLKVIKLSGSSVFQGTATAELESCEENYGFLPCSTSVGGNLFLLVVYGYILLKGAQYLCDGCELLLLVSNPGIIGGLVLPILNSWSDVLIILVSGLSASTVKAQSEVHVGMGLLAGSNIVSLTVLWGGCLAVGRCDLLNRGDNLVAKDKTLTKGWSLTETGVTTDDETRVSSWIMIGTVLPYLIVQAPWTFGWSKKTSPIFMLLGAASCLLCLACYCGYQIMVPWIQQQRIYIAKQKVRRSRYLRRLDELCANKSWGSLLESDGFTPNEDVLGRLFSHFDDNEDELLSKAELKGLITGLGLEHEGKIPDDEEVSQWIEDFDTDNDNHVSRDEFVKGMSKWMEAIIWRPNKRPSTSDRNETQNGDDDKTPRGCTPTCFIGCHVDAENSLKALMNDKGADDDDIADEEAEAKRSPPTPKQVVTKAVVYLIIGAVISGVAADPLVGAIKNFANVTGIPPFFISFVVTPLASSSSDAISELSFAKKKKKKSISLTYFQIYGGVTMSNTLCLGIFLAIVYIRGLIWDFSSEVLVILVATLAIGAIASMHVTYPLWMAIVAVLMYPASIVLIAALDYGLGWQ